MDLGPGATGWPFALEKRYVDVLAPDGTVLLVYLGWMRLLGARMARVRARLFRPGEPARDGAAAAVHLRGGEDWLDLGAARIEGQRLSFETAGLSGRLDLRPRHPPATPRAPLFRQGRHRVEWTVEVPDSDAEGELRWPGGSLRLVGRGYRDRVWIDLPPWRPALRELRWGRIAAAGHASTWLTLDAGREQVSAGWLDGRIAPADACRGSTRDRRALVEEAAVDAEEIGPGLLRPLVRRLVRDPRLVKWACGAELEGAQGVAILEHVRWR